MEFDVLVRIRWGVLCFWVLYFELTARRVVGMFVCMFLLVRLGLFCCELCFSVFAL